MNEDLIFQDIPWDLIYDDNGQVIGEVYVILPDPPPRRRQFKWGTGFTSHLKSMQKQKNTG
ncbi:hypothetical protein D1872_351690 [compost metagenome]